MKVPTTHRIPALFFYYFILNFQKDYFYWFENITLNYIIKKKNNQCQKKWWKHTVQTWMELNYELSSMSINLTLINLQLFTFVLNSQTMNACLFILKKEKNRSISTHTSFEKKGFTTNRILLRIVFTVFSFRSAELFFNLHFNLKSHKKIFTFQFICFRRSLFSL